MNSLNYASIMRLNDSNEINYFRIQKKWVQHRMIGKNERRIDRSVKKKIVNDNFKN